MRHLIEPDGNRTVVRWLRENSGRPIAAMNLWSLLLAKLHHGTGQVLLTRGEIAGEVGVTPREVTSIMKELADIEAVSRQPEGRGVSYFMNPKLFVAPSGEAQEEVSQMPVFEIAESEEEEAGKTLPPDTGASYSVIPQQDNMETPSWAPEGVPGHDASRESDAGMRRRTAANAAGSVWQRWRERLFPAKRKKDD